MEKRELKRRPTNEYRCDERLKVKAKGSAHITYTGLSEGLEHLQIKTRFIKREVSERDGCVSDLETIGVPSIFRVIYSDEALTRMLPTLDLNSQET